MANVADGNGDAAIWGGESSSKITRRRVAGVGAVVGTAGLALGLFFGLRSTTSDDRSNIISGQADGNAVGCFADTLDERIFESQLTDKTMTPELCHTHCETGGYYYYGVQWGIECWCGAETVDPTVHGAGVCDYACGGDGDQICGGFFEMTVYEVGTESTSPSPTPPADGACSDSAIVSIDTSEVSSFDGPNGGCATLTGMYNAQTGDGPLFVLDESDQVVPGGTPTGRWLMSGTIFVTNGVTLQVHGTSIGGDADVLRMESTSSKFFELRGYGGSLSFKSTTVTSWDTNNDVEREYVSNEGRSYINCVTQYDDSEIWDCDGRSNKEYGECRMDIIDSTMGNLGWFDPESYGLTWKVRGMCKDLDPDTGFPVNHEIFEDHNVFGDIMNSEIYGMYYGMYSYGHQGGVWTNNIMRDNILYGFDPHDDSDDLVISGNTVFGNGNHGIIASKRCNNLEITNNEVYNGGESAAGIFLHRSSDDSVVSGNYVHDMQDAGIAVMESSNNEIFDNKIENVKYGIRLSVGCELNNIHDNDFSGISQYGLYTYQGSDEPDVPDSDGRPKNNIFDSNTVSDVDIAVKIKEGDDNVFSNNVFVNVKTFEFEDSSDTTWIDNDVGGGCLDGSADFASGSIPSCS